MTNNIKEKVLNKFSDMYGCENWKTLDIHEFDDDDIKTVIDLTLQEVMKEIEEIEKDKGTFQNWVDDDGVEQGQVTFNLVDWKQLRGELK